MTYLISYDIRSPGKDYTKLLNSIAALTNPRRVLRSCWIVESEMSAAALHGSLLSHTDPNDRLLVCQVNEFCSSNLIPTT